MKKYLPYFIAVLLAGAVIALFLTGDNKTEKQLDERVTLRYQDKTPYGTYAAYKNLKHIFPRADIYTNRSEPGYWDSLSSYETDQALIIITGKFNADESEMKKLISFVEKGNDVFVSARSISYSVADMMNCRVNNADISSYTDDGITVEDSLSVYLKSPPFDKEYNYSYPGKKLDASFYQVDEARTEVIGENDISRPDFIHMAAGKGNFYIHLAPLAFTNYFLLHKDNMDYYEKALSVIDPGVTKVVWDEYYLNKKFLDENEQGGAGWFSVLSRYPALRAALLTAILTMVLFVLLEMRRKQRPIPVLTRPRNDSLDFVRTIGRLYFDKGDHKNLCRKMAAYFLEHVRHSYKLPTGVLDDEFVKHLQFKSGTEEYEIRGIVSFIKYLDDVPAVNHTMLMDFHKQLESFYKKA